MRPTTPKILLGSSCDGPLHNVPSQARHKRGNNSPPLQPLTIPTAQPLQFSHPLDTQCPHKTHVANSIFVVDASAVDESCSLRYVPSHVKGCNLRYVPFHVKGCNLRYVPSHVKDVIQILVRISKHTNSIFHSRAVCP